MNTAVAPDPNVTPYRPDLAAIHLKGTIAADRYAEGVPRQAVRGIVPLRGRPDETAPQTSEILFGETFTVYEERDGWVWGQCATDGYVGYARAHGLDAGPVEPTHRIQALRCFVFPEPDLKTPPMKALSLGARVTVLDRRNGYGRVAHGGWVHETALAPLDTVEPDPVTTAERFLGVPYLWGGRSSLGIDCSGLVQIALGAAGIAVPRDSYMQRAAIGVLVGDDEATPLRRGDIVFFPGHVGLMFDTETLLHANARAMCVSFDPVVEVAERTRRADGAGVTAVRRLPGG